MAVLKNTLRWQNLGIPCWPLEKDGNSERERELPIWREWRRERINILLLRVGALQQEDLRFGDTPGCGGGTDCGLRKTYSAEFLKCGPGTTSIRLGPHPLLYKNIVAGGRQAQSSIFNTLPRWVLWALAYDTELRNGKKVISICLLSSKRRQ